MKQLRTYSAAFFLLLFGWYFSNINLFPHLHTINGNSVVHSHFGGSVNHGHDDDEFSVIDMLSNFMSESVHELCSSVVPYYLSSDISVGLTLVFHAGEAYPTDTLRGPPQA